METLNCNCAALEDLSVVDMGNHEHIFCTLDEVSVRGMPWWWLYASTCRSCGQTWLVAQEERQNDVFILRRLDEATTEQLLSAGIWPTDFDRYETLLQIGRDAGRSVRFVDLADSSLLDTMKDLATERPGISVSELASLLNLEPRVARELARQIVGLTITFDAE